MAKSAGPNTRRLPPIPRRPRKPPSDLSPPRSIQPGRPKTKTKTKTKRGGPACPEPGPRFFQTLPPDC